MKSDHLHRFTFEGRSVRGAILRLEHAWQHLLECREPPFPEPVNTLLGEMVVATGLMRSNIKFEGDLILQVHGDGPLKFAVAEMRADLSFRATAQIVGTLGKDATLTEMANIDGNGQCAITLDPRGRVPGAQAYQGLVPLYDDDRKPLLLLSQALEHYMLQSEQLDTRMVLAADQSTAAGILIQRLPRKGLQDDYQIGQDEDFNHLATLLGTVEQTELLELSPATLLRRLFWEETLQGFPPQPVSFRCSCDRSRVAQMLIGLGREEVEDIIRDEEHVEVACDFCGANYQFDAVDAAELFASVSGSAPNPGTLQ